MKAIMISDKPKWCALMMNGEKNVEVRTSKALANAIQKLIDENGYADIYVYCTKGNEDIIRVSSPYSSVPDYACVKIDKKLSKGLPEYEYSSRGKVIFKFRCYKVKEIAYFEEIEYPDGYENYDGEWIDTSKIYKNVHNITSGMLEKTCLSYEELQKYLGKKNGYAIHINDLEIFDKPKELNEYYGCCDNYTKNVNIFKNINDRYVAQYFDNSKCLKCKHYDGDNWCLKIEEPLTKAPQNYCYVEVLL